jgi:Ca2+-binding EF-hand superfamily protein
MLLYSYLAMFYFVSVQGNLTFSPYKTHSHLLESCNVFTRTITVAAGCISFENFGTWYNGAGFQTMPWIELINLYKWNYAFANDTNPYKSEESQEENEEEDDAEETEAFTVVLYTHYSSSNASYLRVSKRTSQRYCNITKELNLPGDIVTVFFDGAEDGLIGESAFEDISRTVFSAINKSELRSSLNLSKFFNAFDRAGEGSVVDVVELAIGFTIFLEGSKSSKLALAFDLLDDDKDGVLSRRDVWRFFRSFLCGLLFVTGFMSSDEHDIKFLLDASCVWLCDSLFSSIPDDRNVAYFDDIADWYSGNGFKVASWLELLDKKKWVILSQ